MKYSTFDAAVQDFQNQNYNPPTGYVCPDCKTENEVDTEFCDDCGERLIFPSDWFSDEPGEPTVTVELYEPLF